METLGSTQAPEKSNKVRDQPLLLKPPLRVEEVSIIWIPQITSQYPSGTVRCGEDHRGSCTRVHHQDSDALQSVLHSKRTTPLPEFSHSSRSPQLKYPTLPADPSRHYLSCEASGGLAQLLPLNFPQHLAQSLAGHGYCGQIQMHTHKATEDTRKGDQSSGPVRENLGWKFRGREYPGQGQGSPKASFGA